jgi:hypothetical protein
MKRGAVFAFDAMIAASVVLLLLLVWAGANSMAIGSAAADAKEEKMAAKVVAAADWLVKQRVHDFSGWERAVAEKDVSSAKALFKLDELAAELEVYGAGGRTAGHVSQGEEAWCMSRAVVADGNAAILKVCGR